MLCKEMRAMVHSPDGKTHYSDNVTGVSQGDTLAPFVFIICLDYILRISMDLMKENSFTLDKERGRQYPAETITDVDYADDQVLLANTKSKDLKLDLCCIAWSKQQATLVSPWNQLKQSLYVLIKMKWSAHQIDLLASFSCFWPLLVGVVGTPINTQEDINKRSCNTLVKSM